MSLNFKAKFNIKEKSFTIEDEKQKIIIKDACVRRFVNKKRTFNVVLESINELATLSYTLIYENKGRKICKAFEIPRSITFISLYKYVCEWNTFDISSNATMTSSDIPIPSKMSYDEIRMDVTFDRFKSGYFANFWFGVYNNDVSMPDTKNIELNEYFSGLDKEDFSNIEKELKKFFNYLIIKTNTYFKTCLKYQMSNKKIVSKNGKTLLEHTRIWQDNETDKKRKERHYLEEGDHCSIVFFINPKTMERHTLTDARIVKIDKDSNTVIIEPFSKEINTKQIIKIQKIED